MLPAVALAHDQPETKQSNWVMADWMIDTFFVFSGLALVAFRRGLEDGRVPRAGHACVDPAATQEEDYYTPEWALDEEEWS